MDRTGDESGINDICLRFAHSYWIDEVTYLDSTIENYNQVVLYSFLKNDCIDTISVGMTGKRIFAESISITIDGELGGPLEMMRPDTFYPIIPGDSLLLQIHTENEKYINRIDSINIPVTYLLNKERIQQIIKIDGKDIEISQK